MSPGGRYRKRGIDHFTEQLAVVILEGDRADRHLIVEPFAGDDRRLPDRPGRRKGLEIAIRFGGGLLGGVVGRSVGRSRQR
jgi:hypothetical protein